MGSQTNLVRLGPFAGRVYDSLSSEASNNANRPFNDNQARDPPLLRPWGVNRILVFPGTFNPPHMGHLNLLNHIFENAGHDMFLSGAIIIPSDDAQVQKKLRHEQQPFILPREERVQLWREAELPDKSWVFDRGYEDYRTFVTRLREEMKPSGIELQFVLLAGPDWVRCDFLVIPTDFCCTDMITSDVSRPVEFRGSTTLYQVLGCGPWERSTFDVERLRRQFDAKMRGNSPAGTSYPLCCFVTRDDQ